MKRRDLAAVSGLTLVLLAGVTVAAQTTPAPAKAKTPVKSTKPWTPPRMPWGDPDLSGNLTNLYELDTPFERPEQFAGRTLDDIKGAELQEIRKAIRERTTRERSTPESLQLSGSRWFWFDALDHLRGGMPWLVTDPPDGKIPPMAAEGQQRAARRTAERRSNGHGPADSPNDRSLYDRCISRGLPGSMMPAIYGNSYQIVQGPGYVAIRYEMIHETRVIPLDPRPHVGAALRSYMGDARGHWEGDTLVVETANFRDETAYRGADGSSLHLVERFTRTAPDKIMWTVTVNDPKTWTRPWTFGMPLTFNDQEQIFEYACHEGNYAMTNLLDVARAEERAAAEAAKKGIALPAPRSGAEPDGQEK
jgi:hypothetical protein